MAFLSLTNKKEKKRSFNIATCKFVVGFKPRQFKLRFVGFM